MKCPKCKLITSDGRSACPKCGLSFKFLKSGSGIKLPKNNQEPSIKSIFKGNKKKPLLKKTSSSAALANIKKHLDVSNINLKSVVRRSEAPKENEVDDFESFLNTAESNDGDSEESNETSLAEVLKNIIPDEEALESNDLDSASSSEIPDDNTLEPLTSAVDNLLDTNLNESQNFEADSPSAFKDEEKKVASNSSKNKRLGDTSIPDPNAESLSRTPVVSPKVLEFTDGLDWEDKLDELLGEEELNIKSAKSNLKNVIVQEEEIDSSFFIDDDMEVSIDFEVVDEEGVEMEINPPLNEKSLQEQAPPIQTPKLPLTTVTPANNHNSELFNPQIQSTQPHIPQSPLGSVEELQSTLDQEIAGLVSNGNSFASSSDVYEIDEEDSVFYVSQVPSEENLQKTNQHLNIEHIEESDLGLELQELSQQSEEIGHSLTKNINSLHQASEGTSYLEESLKEKLQIQESLPQRDSEKIGVNHLPQNKIKLLSPENSIELIIELEKLSENPIVRLDSSKIDALKKKIFQARANHLRNT